MRHLHEAPARTTRPPPKHASTASTLINTFNATP